MSPRRSSSRSSDRPDCITRVSDCNRSRSVLFCCSKASTLSRSAWRRSLNCNREAGARNWSFSCSTSSSGTVGRIFGAQTAFMKSTPPRRRMYEPDRRVWIALGSVEPRVGVVRNHASSAQGVTSDDSLTRSRGDAFGGPWRTIQSQLTRVCREESDASHRTPHTIRPEYVHDARHPRAGRWSRRRIGSTRRTGHPLPHTHGSGQSVHELARCVRGRARGSLQVRGRRPDREVSLSLGGRCVPEKGYGSRVRVRSFVCLVIV